MQDVLSLKLIAIKEKIKVSQDDYNDYLKTYADYYGADSVEKLLKSSMLPSMEQYLF